MTSTDSANTISKPERDWTPEYLVDNIFVNLMKNGTDKETKSNKYILQFIEKFRYFRIRSDPTFFEIDTRDLDRDTIAQINDYAKDCRTKDERYQRLSGVIVEAVARIAGEAEPLILSSIVNEDALLVKVSLNQARGVLSKKWKLV
jgi:hypothetical protein